MLPDIDARIFIDAVKHAEGGTLFMGRKLHVYPTLDTTMRVVDGMITQDRDEGTMVIALEQTAGRGGTDPKTGTARSWWSGKGNLMFSRIATVPAGRYAKEIEFLAEYTVARIMADLLPRARVQAKFPNDVLVNGEKICGCLVPMSYGLLPIDQDRKVNLGIGINLAAAPPADSLRDNPTVKSATCLQDHGIDMDIGTFITLFDSIFEQIMKEYRQQGFVHILQQMGFADLLTNQMVLYPHIKGPHIKGTYQGFNIAASYQGFTAGQNDDGIPTEYMILCLPNGAETHIAVKSYSTRADITSPHSLNNSPAPHGHGYVA